MIYDRDLLSTLDEVAPSSPWTGIAWRMTFSSQLPLRPNVLGSRWNPPETDCLYTSVTEAGARAEFVHLLAVQPIPPAGPFSIHRIEVDLRRVLDLRNSPLLIRLGVDLPNLPDDRSGHQPCQVLGGAAAFLGFEAILVPSIRSESATLAIFPSKVNFPEGSHFDLIDSRAVDLSSEK